LIEIQHSLLVLEKKIFFNINTTKYFVTPTDPCLLGDYDLHKFEFTLHQEAYISMSSSGSAVLKKIFK
jgi:hypothetical protein